MHIGTGGPRGTSEAIKPLQIAQGQGDAFLIALNEGIAVHEGLVYLRLMAEMNHYRPFHSAFTEGGASKGPQYSPTAYRKAFARMYVILHGGTRSAMNAAFRRLGLPPLVGGDSDLAVNPPSKLRVIWNPLAGGRPVIPANAATKFYPGDRYVDLVGNDMYTSNGIFSAARERGALRVCARSRQAVLVSRVRFGGRRLSGVHPLHLRVSQGTPGNRAGGLLQVQGRFSLRPRNEGDEPCGVSRMHRAARKGPVSHTEVR